MTSKILIVDDEPDILELVQTRLEMSGYETVTAENGEEALKSFFSDRPDLALLDLEMPGMDGFELCERIRQMSDVPIIFLTAIGSETHRVKGLHVGADDYIVKPFSKNELLARVEANLRRASMPSIQRDEQVYVDRVLTIDHRAHLVTVRGNEGSLSPLEYRLLTALLKHPGQVLSHTQLLNLAWEPNSAETSTDSVRLYISYIRGKIEEDPKHPRLVETVRELGVYFQRN
ncbi:MAG: response regulator transcription factor [Chloroflexi bacterium]|nr:response regulator transcription factor [Chloroflexota bacterium]MDA1282376.1 response regulator transcription factor [Chloroflexota bacterium]